MKRFTLLDSLRGIAALAVVFCHLSTFGLKEHVEKFQWLDKACSVLDLGRLGVQIFFVISGFVIVHSLWSLPLTARSIGIFIARRQARLDPAYWVMISITLFVAILGLRGDEAKSALIQKVTVSDILLNLFYLQKITDRPNIVGVAWTLCMEVQFYLLLVVLLIVGKKFSRDHNDARPPLETSRLIGVTSIFSVALACVTPGQAAFHATGLPSWQFFGLGALVYWALRRDEPRVYLWALCFAQVGALLLKVGGWVQGDAPGIVVGLVTAILLYVAGTKGTLGAWGDNHLLLYFGTLSYSLYLTHSLIIKIVFHWASVILGVNPWLFAVGTVASIALCLGIAILFYSLVELPSLRLSQRLRKWAEPLPTQRDVVRSAETEVGAA